MNWNIEYLRTDITLWKIANKTVYILWKHMCTATKHTTLNTSPSEIICSFTFYKVSHQFRLMFEGPLASLLPVCVDIIRLLTLSEAFRRLVRSNCKVRWVNTAGTVNPSQSFKSHSSLALFGFQPFGPSAQRCHLQHSHTLS